MLREYTDKSGTTWRVWDVYPSGRSSPSAGPEDGATDLRSHYPNQHFGNGWLCFECPGEKRRLAPIPVEWELCDCAHLEQLCARAGHISRMVDTREAEGRDAVG